ncbi:potassium-transporting ATPase subunit KdpA [Hymenobacter caeli]|uniref:Potassium-transporting ATPase potassium-binding subunit n=1 Tax=Hymenobacter caeli TaxID=2735894 RepID=A0ABX2FLR8_9BACT|nr:potassium-transporting ATPase subunit KdpA [Hymenobacter caeli]NRT18072.1 K+-transporting ATPase ATPase A chain [Hymenobacter caeli]
MLNTLNVGLLFGLSAALALPVGRYMARVYGGEATWLDPVLAPLENALYRLTGLKPTRAMTWRQYVGALLGINLVWLVWAVGILLVQNRLPFWNPDHIPAMELTQALHTAVSFLTSTNAQHYSGETGASYFAQMAVLTFLQFVSAGTSLAAGIAVVRALGGTDTAGHVGNFYQDLVRSCVRILLPVCLVFSVLFELGGVPMTFAGAAHHPTLEGTAATVARGPVAAMMSIKELGSNGGGFFGPNDAHPFENPTFFTFAVHHVAVMLLPMAFVVMLGYYLRRRRFAAILFAVMTAGLLLLAAPAVWVELRGNPALTALGLAEAPGGNQLEGKEVRFGVYHTAAYAGINMAIPAGTIAGAQDSFAPLTGVPFMLLMQIDAFFGGVGTGFLNMFIYIVITAFIASLMVGRSPELLGKKVEAREMQAATLVAVAQPVVVLACTGLAAWLWATTPHAADALKWLSNPGAHGFSTMLYEFISAASGNGSGFGGLGSNNPFWNLTPCLAMLSGRFVPIVGALIIAAGLLAKNPTPPSLGGIRLESATFAVLLLVVIGVLGALLFFPALTLGPLAEYFGGR